MTQPTGRPGIDDLTSDQLDQLYDRLEKAELKAEAMTAAMQSTATDALKHRGCHMKLMAQCTRADRAEATLNAVRELLPDAQHDANPTLAIHPSRIRAVLDQHGQTTKEPT